VKKEEEAFLCPFCGAPYRELIPAGVVQVKCRYCGSLVLVPPRLGGLVKRCPNHAETLAIGLCSKCNEGYCDYCLHILWTEHGDVYLCENCLEKQRKGQKWARLFFVLLIASGVGLLILPRVVPAISSMQVTSMQVLSMVLLLIAFFILINSPKSLYQPSLPTVHERMVKIDSYVKEGFSREEAIRKVAKDELYP